MPGKVVSIKTRGHRAALLARRDALVLANLDLARNIARAIAAGLPPSFDPDDLTSTAYVGLLTAATRFRPGAHRGVTFRSYAWQVIRGAIIDSIRRGNWVENTRAAIDQFDAPGECPAGEDAIDVGRRDRRVAAAVATLSAREQALIRWHYHEELGLEVIGDRLGVTPSRASQIHMGAIRSLRARLTA